MTSCRAGAVCHEKTPPDAVSWKEIVDTASLLVRKSARGPGSRSMTPSSKREARSSPVHRCTHLIICLLLWRLRALRKTIDYRLHLLFAGRQRSSAIARSVFYSHMSLAGHPRLQNSARCIGLFTLRTVPFRQRLSFSGRGSWLATLDDRRGGSLSGRV